MSQLILGPGRRRDRTSREKLKVQSDLKSLESVRQSIVNTPDDKWAKNFTTSKDNMLKSVETQIGELRRKLGLLV
jgi:hypothetical protein